MCRFARHHTFMYLLYDIIQLRQSSLANSILVKRQHWKSTATDIESLTLEQLEKARKAIAAGQKVEDPVVKRLQKNLLAIGKRVPGSFAQKLMMRSDIKGAIVRYGMPAFWITINPSDLRNPLVIKLAGIEYSGDIFATANAAIRKAVATSNPVAVAEFFHHICTAVFEGLFATNSDRIGILGDLSNHFGVVETNGRGMFHLHSLVWVRGNTAFSTLHDRLREDSHFAARMIHYLETTIKHGVDETFARTSDVRVSEYPPPSKGQESDDDFLSQLYWDGNAVADTVQRHSKNHTATCFKYRRRGSGKEACRFNMPRELVASSTVDESGIVHLARNDAWVNPWNPAIASCIRSNQDVSWIPTVSKSLALVYYITNYATKDDVSPEQLLAKAALLKQSIEKAKTTEAPTPSDLRLREKGMDKFAQRCFNTLACDREISGVQVASTLLQLPTFYTVNSNFISINLWWLRWHIRSIVGFRATEREGNSLPTEEEPCRYEAGEKTPVTLFDNYRCRGPLLASLSLYEYCMLVQTRNQWNANIDDIAFDPSHPRHGTLVQHLAHRHSDMATVTFIGQLTEFQVEEDSIRGGHPKTDAILNDIAEILLGLFVPWQDLPPLSLRHATSLNPYTRVWTAVEPSLPPHRQEFAKNVELLRKSKEDCQLDAILRKEADGIDGDGSFDRDIDELDLADFDSDDEDETCFENPATNVNVETLIAAYHSVQRSWHQETLASARKIPALARGATLTQDLPLSNLMPVDGSALEASGLRFFPPSALESWQSRLKRFRKSEDDSTGLDLDFEADDSNVEAGGAVLQPVLTTFDDAPAMEAYRSLVGQNPTGASLTSLVHEKIPLNRKQRLVVEKVLSAALAWKDHPYDRSKRDQLLLHLTGEGGVGKSRIVKAIVAGMDLIERNDEVMTMAPTGIASDKIGGNTYHTALSMPIVNRKEKTSLPPRINRLWAGKTIMVIDEISMVDLHHVYLINRHCNMAKSLPANSSEFLGGLPVVIWLGDFFQFPPVQGTPLWKLPSQNDNKENFALFLWHQFKDVIFLDEQMRQSRDPAFRQFLSRARAGTFTEDDLAFLNSKVITSLTAPELDGVPIVVKRNKLRHLINIIRIVHFAKTHFQRIYIFPAEHTRMTCKDRTARRLLIEDLLRIQDDGCRIPFAGLFLFTPNMPAMMLTNACTLLGQVNGATGTAVGVVPEPNGTSRFCSIGFRCLLTPNSLLADFFEIDDLYVMCTKPPACVLFKYDTPRFTGFDGLDHSITPIFPFEKSIFWKGYSIRRRQVPLCPAFCLTQYKVQGLSLKIAVLDMKAEPRRTNHERYTSNNVLLGRLETSKGVYLLQRIEMSDLLYKPDPRLLAEINRLRVLERETLSRWGERPAHQSF